MSADGDPDADLIEVVAGVLRDDRGRILLSRRPEGKHLAGTWEFPGGKLDADESATDALARELAEELGIRIAQASPWLSVTHAYPELSVRLRLFTVAAWSGQPRGLEGQRLRWVAPQAMPQLEMPAADRPIVRALSLSPRYAIAPEAGAVGGLRAVADWVDQALEAGHRLFRLSSAGLDEAAVGQLGRDVGERIGQAGGTWLLAGSIEQATRAGADGVDLSADRLRAIDRRPLPADRWLAAACHDAGDLAAAARAGVDFLTLSPLRETASHPGRRTLGWSGFEALCARSPAPVFAAGGVAPEELRRVRELGGFGVAETTGVGAP